MRYVLSNDRAEYLCGPHFEDVYIGCRLDRAASFDSPKEAMDWLCKFAKDYTLEFEVYKVEVIVKKYEEE